MNSRRSIEEKIKNDFYFFFSFCLFIIISKNEELKSFFLFVILLLFLILVAAIFFFVTYHFFFSCPNFATTCRDGFDTVPQKKARVLSSPTVDRHRTYREYRTKGCFPAPQSNRPQSAMIPPNPGHDLCIAFNTKGSLGTPAVPSNMFAPWQKSGSVGRPWYLIRKTFGWSEKYFATARTFSQ